MTHRLMPTSLATAALLVPLLAAPGRAYAVPPPDRSHVRPSRPPLGVLLTARTSEAPLPTLVAGT
jgi:hypothetical protein